jgi:hypothetical protein
MKIYSPDPPEALFKGLVHAYLKYTSPECVYHIIWLGSEAYCGVFGDGDNALYEWFFLQNGVLTTSNVGYGNTAAPLRDALTEAEKAGWL